MARSSPIQIFIVVGVISTCTMIKGFAESAAVFSLHTPLILLAPGRRPMKIKQGNGKSLNQYFVLIRSCVFSMDLPEDCEEPQIAQNSTVAITNATARSNQAVQWTLSISNQSIQCKNAISLLGANAFAFLTCNRLPHGPPTAKVVLEETKDYFSSTP